MERLFLLQYASLPLSTDFGSAQSRRMGCRGTKEVAESAQETAGRACIYEIEREDKG